MRKLIFILVALFMVTLVACEKEQVKEPIVNTTIENVDNFEKFGYQHWDTWVVWINPYGGNYTLAESKLYMSYDPNATVGFTPASTNQNYAFASLGGPNTNEAAYFVNPPWVAYISGNSIMETEYYIKAKPAAIALPNPIIDIHDTNGLTGVGPPSGYELKTYYSIWDNDINDYGPSQVLSDVTAYNWSQYGIVGFEIDQSGGTTDIDGFAAAMYFYCQLVPKTSHWAPPVKN